MSRWARTAGLVLTPALLLSVALLGCSSDAKDGKKAGGKKDGGGEKKDGGGGGAAGKLEPVKLGSGTISGTVTLKKGVEPDYDKLNADLKDAVEKSKYKSECKQAKEQTLWIIDKSSRGVQNVAVWIMPEKDDQFFDVKDLVEKKKFDKVVVLDQPHCHFVPRVLMLFPDYVDPSKPLTEDGQPNYVSTGQKFYAVNPEDMEHNTKLTPPPGGGKAGSAIVPRKTTAKEPQKGLDLTDKCKLQPTDPPKPTQIGCDVHAWMGGTAWALPHPLATTTDEKGNFKIENVPDSGKVRIFVWHEAAGFITPRDGKVIDAKEGKQDFTIEKTK